MSLNLVPQEAFDSGLLNPEYHEHLIREAKRFTRKAGVPVQTLWMRMSTYCTESEMAWMKNFRASEDCGLVFSGKFDKPVEEKMMSMVGACLRNYIDSRIMSVQEVVRRLKEDDMPQPTLLLIPHFCLDKASGGDIATWDVAHLNGLLVERMAAGLKTILQVHSLATVEKQYGEPFRAHLEAHYSIVTKTTFKSLAAK